MYINPVHATDFYKTGHIRQYPDGTQMVYANFTCRSDKLANLGPDFDHKVVFFGLQGTIQWLLIDLWNREFFHKPKDEILAKYKKRMDSSLGEGAVGLGHIADLHDLGYLPIHIKALPEGSRVPMRVPCYTIRNTIGDFYWLTNYLETQLSAETWKPITSATTAFEYRKMFEKYAKMTGVPRDFVSWQGHDFSFRGMSGIYDAASSGAGHLMSFFGTDTISAIDYLENYYPHNFAEGVDTFIGGSVPATEHSVMCMGGKDDELETFRRLITKVYPKGIVSIVSDTWDFWKVVTQYAKALAPEILAREGKVVFRPDSGDPVKIIAGDPDAPVGSPENKGVVSCLWDIFGGTMNSSSYRELNSKVGTIYGDSITLDRSNRILHALYQKGYASSNTVFGIGSFTYQHVTRDTFGSAIKGTYGVVNGKGRALSKSPKTDSGTKKSAEGLLRVELVDGEYQLFENQTWAEEAKGELKTVFLNGKVDNVQSTATVRRRLGESLC